MLNYASVAHPQSNGQVEKANGLVTNGIKKRLLVPLRRAAGVTKDNFGRSKIRVPGLIEGGEERRVLVLTTADKQEFTQVQSPQVEVKALLLACLICY